MYFEDSGIPSFSFFPCLAVLSTWQIVATVLTCAWLLPGFRNCVTIPIPPMDGKPPVVKLENHITVLNLAYSENSNYLQLGSMVKTDAIRSLDQYTWSK